MNKIEALKYICDNYHGSDGGFQFACLVEVIQEDKALYTEHELNTLIKEMTDFL